MVVVVSQVLLGLAQESDSQQEDFMSGQHFASLVLE